MKKHARAHRLAMLWVDRVDEAKYSTSKTQALQKALAFEVMAARSVEDDPLTRAVLFRSAATLAHQVGAPKAAIHLVAELLETGDVPGGILLELAELLRSLDPDLGPMDMTMELYLHGVSLLKLADEYNVWGDE